ncbi:MAG: DUF4290 domain-containing protein [Bacteroidetes bacterium]|jgi:hypothetical protein|nr:MAG: DUF4290 domain-containing protein [Bacteroidota bacterium]
MDKMLYNTELEPIRLPEYGRIIQNMVKYCLTIEDRNKRNECAKMIVKIMAQLHPNTNNSPNYEQKLWDHLFIISDFKLDVDSPYPKPQPDLIQKKPEPLTYVSNKINYLYYGKNVENIIKALDKVENPEEREYYILVTANYMKKLQNMWNKEANIKDHVIFEHLRKISEGKIDLDPNVVHLDVDARMSNRKKNFKQKFQYNKRKNNNGNKNH